MKSRHVDILRVLDAVQEMELARLSKMASAHRATAAELAELRTRRTAHFDAASAADRPPPSAICGADEKWRLWVDREVQRIIADLARLAAKKEAQTQKSRTALGRMRAMKNIIEKHQMRRISRRSRQA